MSLMQSAYKSFSAQELPKKEINVGNTDFRLWTAVHHYRTNYRDMSKKCEPKEKKYAIPGYSGYIPSTGADGNFAKTFTQVSREQLNREKYLPERTIENFPQRPATSEGRSLGKFGGGLSDEYHSISRFHGKCTIPFTHPNYAGGAWETSYAASWTNKEQERTQLFRTTDTQAWKAGKSCPRPKTQASGFNANSTLFDGHGWLPMKHFHGDMKNTEYRGRFNMYVNFHPRPLGNNPRKMRQKSKVY